MLTHLFRLIFLFFVVFILGCQANPKRLKVIVKGCDGTYEGDIKDMKANGFGTLKCAEGFKFSGEWKDGKYIKGTALFSDGEVFVGDIKDFKRHGFGETTFKDGSKYVGHYENNRYHGHGTYIFSDGTKYVGEFLNGAYNGQGTLTYSNGDTLTARWKDNKPEGLGIMTFQNGDTPKEVLFENGVMLRTK